jgi:hypothetical protein
MKMMRAQIVVVRHHWRYNGSVFFVLLLRSVFYEHSVGHCHMMGVYTYDERRRLARKTTERMTRRNGFMREMLFTIDLAFVFIYFLCIGGTCTVHITNYLFNAMHRLQLCASFIIL